MKHIADRGYKDLQLNRHVEKGAILEEEYEKDNKELTAERISYLVDERKLYIPVEEEETTVDEAETTEEDNKEETSNEVEESNEEETTKNTKKNATKSKTKNTKKDDEK